MITPLLSRSLLVMILLCVGLWSGCSSSEEATTEKAQVQPPQPSATELMQRDMANLHSKNDSLLIVVSKLERDNQSAMARATEAETQLNDMKAQAAAPPPKPKPVVRSSGGTYDQGLQLFRTRNYQDAANIFQSIIDAGVPADLQDNCHYWLGECAYATKAFKEAISHFNEVFTFKISEKKDDAQMMIANSYLAMGDKTKAKAEYQKLIDKYPASTYIPRAKEKLGKL